MMLKKSLISILLIMCFLVGNLSTASAFEEDINVQNNGFADVGSAYEPDSFESESSVTDDNIIVEDEKLVKVDENTQSELTSTVSGPGPYDITPGVAPDDFAVNIEEGETCQLNATNPYGILFTWSTTDPEIATVSAQGLVTAHKAGNVTVTASFFHNGGTFSARCTVYVYIDVGAFYVKNVSSGYYLNVQNGTINNYTNVQVRSKYPNSMDEKYRIQQIWRLHHLGNGRYSFRPFHKLDMALTVTGTNADIYNIGSLDTLSSVPSKAEWEIYWHMNGYIITNNGDNGKVLQTENGSTASGANVVVGSYSYSGTQRWFLDKINDPPKGVIMYDTQTGYRITSATKTIVLGETKTLSDLNLTVASYQPLTSGNLTNWESSNPAVATVGTSNGTITAVSCGKATITASAHNKTVSYTLWVIPIPEGTYFINNREKGGYIQIDDDASDDYSESGVHMEHHTFDGGDYQKWQFIHLNNGFYKIQSVESGLCLAVPSDGIHESDVDIVQESYSNLTRKQWTVVPTTDGAFKIRNRSAITDIVLCVNPGTANGTNIQQDDYLNNNSYLDEWYMVYIGAESGVDCEAQKKSNWCWAAASRMFAKHFYPTVTYTQNQMVTHIKGSEINSGGNRSEANSGIHYYISNINGASIDTRIIEEAIYSEEILLKYLDDGYVIYVARRWYEDPNDPESINGGHATLIYGYTMINAEYRFLIHDPLPVNEGNSYLISYEKLCNGFNPQWGEDQDQGIWYASIVVNTSYSDDTIPWHFDN